MGFVIGCGTTRILSREVHKKSWSLFDALTPQEAQTDLDNLFREIHTEVNAEYVSSICQPQPCNKTSVNEQTHKRFHGPIRRSWGFWFKLVSYQQMHVKFAMTAVCTPSG